jgi:hypothetical protein
LHKSREREREREEEEEEYTVALMPWKAHR